MTIKYITISKFSELSGYSEDAIRSKIKRGDWPHGYVFIKAEDERILISLEGFNAWVEGKLKAA